MGTREFIGFIKDPDAQHPLCAIATPDNGYFGCRAAWVAKSSQEFIDADMAKIEEIVDLQEAEA